MKKHYKAYLKLTRSRGDDRPIIIYREDENGNPILDYRKIGLISVRGNTSDVTMAFDSNNDYKFMRYEVLEKNFEVFGKLKELVDEKISCLEDKIDSEKVN